MRFLSLFLLALAAPASAQDARVLFIGNSYVGVNDLPNTFRMLALSMGRDVYVASSAPGGYQLIQHSTYQPTLDAIASQQWDFVALQEQSQMGAFPFSSTQTDEGAAALAGLIRANDPCSTPVFYMTWGRENGDDLNCPNYPPVCTYEGMQQALTANYVQLAFDNDALVAPVGSAWRTVRQTQPQVALYASDGSHPTMDGTYLAASVFYATLFREPCTSAAFTAGLPPDRAAILRSIASATVLDDPDQWNLSASDAPDAAPLTSHATDWNTVSYHHGGQGTHLWTASDGQQYAGADATFSFTAPGTYTITHVFTNECGVSGMATWQVAITATGISAPDALSGAMAWWAEGALQVVAPEPGCRLDLMDAAGRLVQRAHPAMGHTAMACAPGAYVWRITGPGAGQWTGRVVAGW